MSVDDIASRCGPYSGCPNHHNNSKEKEEKKNWISHVYSRITRIYMLFDVLCKISSILLS